MSARPARLAWLLWGAGMTLIAIILAMLWVNHGVPTPPRWGFRGVQAWIALPVLTSGTWIAAQRPRNRVGWLLLVSGLLASLTGFGEEYAVHALLVNAGRLPGGEIFGATSQWLWLPAYALLNVFVPLYFPDGRLHSPRWRVVVWLGILWVAWGSAWLLFAPGALSNLSFVENPFGQAGFSSLYDLAPEYPLIPLVPGIVLMMIAVFSLGARYRGAERATRQQVKWMLFGAAVTTLAGPLGYSGYFGLLPAPLAHALLIAAIYTYPLAILVAILRHNLFDIDLLINRTLVYGALSALILGLYAAVVGAMGVLFQARSNLVVSLLATGLAAVLFQPLRQRLQGAVNRLMYGERDDPTALLSRLGAQLEKTGSPEAALQGMVETVARALKLPYAAIILGAGDEVTASYGLPVNEIRTFPLVYQGEAVGEMRVATRAPGENFTPQDRRLLETIAHQAGAAAHAARLTADLRRAHQQLVAAREEERRRIRRDLHDGLGPQLAGQVLTLTAARRLAAEDPQAADALLTEAIRHAQAATDDVRRLVHGLRPPALDDLGLAGALRALLRRFERGGLNVIARLPEDVGELPAAVETACYFICQEALNNVLRHAGASQCALSLWQENESLYLEIEDNGAGLPADRHEGLGLRSMCQRAEEVGGSFSIASRPDGGTRISLRLPLH